MTYAAQLKNNLGSADTGRAPSPGIWGDCPILSILDGSLAGIMVIDDFDKGGLITSPTTSAALVGVPYSGFGDTGSTITQPDERPRRRHFAVHQTLVHRPQLASPTNLEGLARDDGKALVVPGRGAR